MLQQKQPDIETLRSYDSFMSTLTATTNQDDLNGSRQALDGATSSNATKSIIKKPVDYEFSIAVVGDMGVGKTSLLGRECRDTQRGKPKLPSSGNNNTPQLQTPSQQTGGIRFKSKCYDLFGTNFRVTYWDVVGDEKFRGLSGRIAGGATAVVLVFDVTNRKSFENIRQWLSELDRYRKNLQQTIFSKRDPFHTSTNHVLGSISLMGQKSYPESKYSVDMINDGNKDGINNGNGKQDANEWMNGGGLDEIITTEPFGVESDSFKLLHSGLLSTPVRLLIGNKIDEPGEKKQVTNNEINQLIEEYEMDYFECSALSGENVHDAFGAIVASVVKQFPDEGDLEPTMAALRKVKILKELKEEDKIRYREAIKATLPHQFNVTDKIDWL